MTFDINTSSPVNAHDFSRPVMSLARDFGIYVDAAGAVTTNAGLTVNVAALPANTYVIGRAVQANAYVAATVSAGAAHATLYRRDVVYIDTAGAVGVAAGTAAALTSAVAPTLAATRLALAELTIAPTQTVLASTDIFDKRVRIPQIRSIRKPTDETVTTSATLQNDDHFFFYADVSKTYRVTLAQILTATLGNGYKAAWTLPAGGTHDAAGHAHGTGNALIVATAAGAASGTNFIVNDSVVTGEALIVCRIMNSTTAGLVTMQFAQSNGGANTAVNGAGGNMYIEEIF